MKDTSKEFEAVCIMPNTHCWHSIKGGKEHIVPGPVQDEIVTVVDTLTSGMRTEYVLKEYSLDDEGYDAREFVPLKPDLLIELNEELEKSEICL